MKACPHCSRQLHDGAAHCGYCGARVEEAGALETVLGMSPISKPQPPEDDEDNIETVAMPALRPEDFDRMHAELAARAAAEEEHETAPQLPAARLPAAAVPGTGPTDPDMDRAITPVLEPPSPPETDETVAMPPVSPGSSGMMVPRSLSPAPPGTAAPPADAPAPAGIPLPPADTPAAATEEEGQTLEDGGPEEAFGAVPTERKRRRAQDAPTLVLDSPLEGLQEAMEAARRQKLREPGAPAAPGTVAGAADEPEVPHHGIGRTVALVGFIVVPILGLLTAAAIFLAGGQIRIRFDSRVAFDRAKGQYQVTATVIVEEGDPNEKLVLSMLGKEEEFSGNRQFVFDVPKSDLKVGVNPIEAVVKLPDGAEVGRFPASILVDYEFEVERTRVRPDDSSFTALFRIADGSSLFVDGAGLEPTDDGRLAAKVPLADVMGRIDTLPQAEYPFELRFTVQRPDGNEVPHSEMVRLQLPQAELEVLRPPRRYVTTMGRVTLVGRTKAGTEVEVAGRRVKVGADGSFTFPHAVPTLGDHRIDVKARRKGVVDAVHRLELERISPAELTERNEEERVRGGDWAGKDAVANPAWPALSKDAGGELKGKRAVIQGVVQSLQQGPESVVLVVSTCGRPNDCLVWAELSQGAVSVGLGEKATFFGTVEGTKKLPRPGGEVQVPFLRVQHAAGG